MFRSTRPSWLALGVVLVGGLPTPALPAAAPTPSALAEARLKAAQSMAKAAQTAYEATVKAFRAGRSDAEKVYVWSRRWLEAQHQVADKKAARTAGLKAHRDRMKDLRQAALTRYRAGQAPFAEVAGADYYLAEAELWLVRGRLR
jgi:outer membrane protein TolC